MTQWHTSTQGLEDTLTYVELVNSFIIAEIRIPAFAKWSGLWGSWEGTRNLVRSIVGWQSLWLGFAVLVQLLVSSSLFLSFLFPPSLFHLFELSVFFVTCDSASASSLHFSPSICDLCKTDNTQIDFPLVCRLPPSFTVLLQRHSLVLFLVVRLWEWHCCHCTDVTIG